jgi:flagella basal body P-ring formation protein FlgA
MNRNILKSVLALAALLCCRVAMAQDADTPETDSDAPSGDVLQAQTAAMVEPLPASESFVSNAVDVRSFSGGSIVLRSDATVTESVIRVRNICRWSASDAAIFQPVADLAVAHMNDNQAYATVTLDQIRDTLSAAGVNLALVSFDGATSCAVNRDIQADAQADLNHWMDSNQPPASASAAPPRAHREDFVTGGDGKPLRTLRDELVDDFCQRLHLDPTNLELSFSAGDEKVVKLVEPYFKFDISPRRVRSLGPVSWDVVITANGQQQKATINADARLWVTEAVLAKPLAYQQQIRDGDIEEKRVLTDELTNQTFLSKTQAVGQEASHELQPGTVLTAGMIDPTLMAKPGQLVTVNVVQGNVRITAVGRAMEAGSFGQTIRVRNDIDPTSIFDVTLNGPQQGTVSSTPEPPSPVAAADDKTSTDAN